VTELSVMTSVKPAKLLAVLPSAIGTSVFLPVAARPTSYAKQVFGRCGALAVRRTGLVVSFLVFAQNSAPLRRRTTPAKSLAAPVGMWGDSVRFLQLRDELHRALPAGSAWFITQDQVDEAAGTIEQSPEQMAA
jgi:hypothetical protein